MAYKRRSGFSRLKQVIGQRGGRREGIIKDRLHIFKGDKGKLCKTKIPFLMSFFIGKFQRRSLRDFPKAQTMFYRVSRLES